MQSLYQPSLDAVAVQILELGVEWGKAAQTFQATRFAGEAEERAALDKLSNSLLDRGLDLIPVWIAARVEAERAGRIVEPERFRLVESLLADIQVCGEMRRAAP